jgi:nucleoside-diphosphate-sugar epimerase
MKIIVTGATGTVGAEVIRQAILDKDIESITALSRKPIPVQHGRVSTIMHKDFLDYNGLENVFHEHDACIWCLGISQSQVSKQAYEVITYDYAMAAAKAMKQANRNMTFLFLSGAGADSAEKSRTLFARVKGKTENALQRLMPEKKLIIARPAGIKPVHLNPNTSLWNKMVIPLFPIFELIMPSIVISSVDLAKAMLHLVKHGSDKVILENVDLKKISILEK